MDTFRTCTPPTPTGAFITIRLKTNPRNGLQCARLYNHDISLLTTSVFFQQATLSAPQPPFAVFTFPDPEVFEIYLSWTRDRIVRNRVKDGNRNAKIPAVAVQGSSSGSAEEAEAAREGTVRRRGVVEKVGYSTLLSLWVLGHKLQDTEFMDTVMSFLSENLNRILLDPDPDSTSTPTQFLEVLTPAKVKFVWDNTTKDSMIRTFVLETTAQFASFNLVKGFLAKPETGHSGRGTYANIKNFQAELETVLQFAMPRFLVPEGVRGVHPKLLRILLPPPPYVVELVGGVDVGWCCRMVQVDTLTGKEMQDLARRMIEGMGAGGKGRNCRYHEHGRVGIYADNVTWFPLSSVQKAVIENTTNFT
ncbi:uncharacterized protein BDR25DRAFT_314934 [Lindgomyces ingoldianus]|uniref:Uncharacterized protein n=1 Tax=Lindgomyces ingoldianus TaxID=673940 RepID=A0ACB6QT57_9PLEO|nr:uncharacterized protein BDR25DRAFT_314934 [Lindgomyces ingoldianus]KAF2470209.1 hypothetical protein BDR25DRAFT_314934 [Lindgomyces ingoldianus]